MLSSLSQTTLSSDSGFNIVAIALALSCPIIIVLASFLFARIYGKNSANWRTRSRQTIEKEEGIVRLHSKLYKEITALNNGKRSLRNKKFTYSRTGYVFIATYKGWKNYSAKDYLDAHRTEFERDRLNLQLFIDDCVIYQECIDKLWQKYAADELSITESGMDKSQFVEIEERLCKALVLPIPPVPCLQYDILLECGRQKRTRHIEITQDDVVAFLNQSKQEATQTPPPATRNKKPKDQVGAESAKLQIATNKTDSKSENEKDTKQESEPASKPDSVVQINIELSPEPKSAAQDSSDPEPEAVSTSQISGEEAMQSCTSAPAAGEPLGFFEDAAQVVLPETDKLNHLNALEPIADEAFDRYFNSIDALERENYFWARLDENEQSLIKHVTKTVFDSRSNLLPSNQVGTFCFRTRNSYKGVPLSLFWFKKPHGEDLTFSYRENAESLEYESIPAAHENYPAINECVLRLLSIGNSALKKSESQPIKLKPVAQSQPEKTAEEIAHEQALARFPELDWNNEDLFYAKIDKNGQYIIDSVLLVATGMNRKIVPQNATGTFGFGRCDDLQNGFGWFGFRKRLGEGLTFFHKETRYSTVSSSTVANIHQLDTILKTVRTIVNKDYGIPVRKPPETPSAVKTKSPEPKSPLSPDSQHDADRFYHCCTPTEKAIIDRIIKLSTSLNADITYDNRKDYFGFKRRWEKGQEAQYWYWFRKPDGETLSFTYRERQDSTSSKQIGPAQTEKQVAEIESIVRRLLVPSDNTQSKPNPASVASNADEIQAQKSPNDPVLSNPTYFFAKLNSNEKIVVSNTIQYVKTYWSHLQPVNTKNFLGFKEADNYASQFWFWFKKSDRYTLQFVYRANPDDSLKSSFAVRGNSIDQIAKTLSAILPDAIEARKTSRKTVRVIKPANSPVSPKSPSGDSFWNKSYLYASEIVHKCGMPSAVSSTDLAAVCTLHHFTYRSGVAFSNEYGSLADAIYQSEITGPGNTIFIYSNPYNCQEYDRAIQKLLDELKLFDLGEGRYLTNVGLQQDYGINIDDCLDLKNKVKEFLQECHFFSLDNIRAYCAKCRFFEFGSSDRILTQFIRSIIGHNLKTILTDQDSSRAVYSTGMGEIEMKKFFVFVMENEDVMDIYAIKDRVGTLFGINYSLDLIGKDAERAGFFYSEDLEKVYKNKKLFYKEIQE